MTIASTFARATAFAALLGLAGCAANSDSTPDSTEDDLRSKSTSLTDYLGTVMPLVANDPAFGRRPLEQHYENLGAATNKVPSSDLPGEHYPFIHEGQQIFNGLAKRAASTKAAGYSTTGPEVYRETFDKQIYFIVDYTEMRPGGGGSGWMARAVVAEGGSLIAVGTLRLGSAAPSGNFTWRGPWFSVTPVHVSVCPVDADRWNVNVFVLEENLRKIVGKYDGFEHIEAKTYDPFAKREHSATANYNAEGSTPGVADYFTIPINDYSEAVYGNNRIPLKIVIKTNTGTVEMDAGNLPNRGRIGDCSIFDK